MATPEIDQLYINTIVDFDHEEKSRFRELVYSILRGLHSSVDWKGKFETEHDALWTQTVQEAVVIAKTWIPERERRAILMKMDAMEDEYNEALAAQDAMNE